MALLGALTDDFSATNATKWTYSAAASISAGQLVLGNNTSYTGSISSAATWDLTNSEIIVEIPRIASGTAGTSETFVILANAGNPNGDNIRIQVSGANLSAFWALGGVQQAGAVTVAYNATSHRWWRIRHTGTNVLCQTSPDRVTWTTVATLTPTIAITAMSVFIGAGGGSAGQVSALVDNVNVAPTVTATASASFSGSGSLSATGSGGAASPRGQQVGVAIGAGDLEYISTAWVDARLDEVKNLGAKWIRTDVNWSWIEGTQGTYDWTWTDYVVTGAIARGLKCLLIIGTIPSWARPAGAAETYGIVDATARSRYNTFCTAVVNRYVPQGVLDYELWNEPNHPPFWTTPNAGLYTQMVQGAYSAIKTARPTAKVHLGGTAWTDTASGGILTANWYTQLYANGIKGSFDYATQHAYQDPAAAGTGSYDTGELSVMQQVRSTMNANGDSAIPIWNTETGFPTGGSNSVTQAVQRDAMAGGRTVYFNREPSGVLFIYTMRDRQAAGASTNREDYFGITSTTAQKLAYPEWQSWIAAGATSPALSGSGTFSGSGSLSASVKPALARTATLSGSGSLSAAAKPASARSATLTGSGSLSTVAGTAAQAPATLSGLGTLIASGASAANISAQAPVAFSGLGALIASPRPGALRTAIFTGLGLLAVAADGYGGAFMWNGAAWEPASIQSWDGSQWRPAKIATY